MSSNSTPRRHPNDTSASASPPIISQQQYYPHLTLNPHAPYQFQTPQPFPQFQQQHQHHQLHTPPQLQSHHHLTQHQSPYGQSPPHQHIPQHQSMQQQPPLPPHIPSQAQPTSPPSRKRKAPGDLPSVNMSSMTPTMSTSLGPDMTQGPPVKAEGLGEDSITEPAPKKSRTNTPWTAIEENRLRGLKTQAKSWGEIAKSFPNRTEGSVKKHWYKDMHHAEFAEDESQALLNAIKEYEANKWKVIGQKVGKPAKACEQYYKEHFQGKI